MVTMIQMQKIISFFLISILCFANSALIQYPLFILLMVLLLTYNFFSPRPFVVKIPRTSWHDAVALLFLICWLYGVVVGLLSGNKVNYIFANFAGMIFYILYFIMIRFNVSKEKLFNLLLFASMINLASNLLVKIFQTLLGGQIIDNKIISAIFGTFTTGSSTGQLRLLNINQLVIFVLLSVLLFRFLQISSRNKHCDNYVLRCSIAPAFILIFLSLYVLVFMSASKGYMLAVIFILSTFFYSTVFNKSFTFGSLFKFFVGCVFCVVFYGILESLKFSNIIFQMFAQSDESNVIRYIQLAGMIQDLTLLGNGLGAEISGMIRNQAKPYGFELTYINLIHKIGILSIPLFWCYFYSLYKAIIELRKQESWHYGAAALGSLCFLFPSIGNPMLFSPQMVALHCAALFLLRPH